MNNDVKKIYLLIRDINENYKDTSIFAERRSLNSFIDSVLLNVNEAIIKFNNLMVECELVQIEIIDKNHPSYVTIAKKEIVILDKNSIRYRVIIVNDSVIKDAKEKIFINN